MNKQCPRQPPPPLPSPLPFSSSSPATSKPMSAHSHSPAALQPSPSSTKTVQSSPTSTSAPSAVSAPLVAPVKHIHSDAGISPSPSSPSSYSLPSPDPAATAKPKSDPSSAINFTSTCTGNPIPVASAEAPTASNTAGTGATTTPAKIPSRPKKTRKLASSSTAQQGDVKAETGGGGGAEDGSNGSCAIVVAGGATPVEVRNRARVFYRVLPRPLSAEGEVALAIHHLRAADPQLARLIDAHEPPVFQSLHPPFHSLARSILYQQLAFKAAASIYSRFIALCGGEAGVVPETVLGLTPHQLRQIGVSARKASYIHDLANKYRNGILSDESIVGMDDKSLFTMLTMVKGIGAWSVHMFMIFSLHRPDVLPVGDLGVRKGVQLLYGLDTLPRPSQMEQLCEKWKPYRSVGAWYMWRLVEAKGAPAALATVPASGAAIEAAPGGGEIGGASLVVGVPPALPPPLHHQNLQPQIQQQQQHPQSQDLHQRPHTHQHQHQHQHQLQMHPQIVDAVQSIPNLGLLLKHGEWSRELWSKE